MEIVGCAVLSTRGSWIDPSGSKPRPVPNPTLPGASNASKACKGSMRRIHVARNERRKRGKGSSSETFPTRSFRRRQVDDARRTFRGKFGSVQESPPEDASFSRSFEPKRPSLGTVHAWPRPNPSLSSPPPPKSFGSSRHPPFSSPVYKATSLPFRTRPANPFRTRGEERGGGKDGPQSTNSRFHNGNFARANRHPRQRSHQGAPHVHPRHGRVGSTSRSNTRPTPRPRAVRKTRNRPPEDPKARTKTKYATERATNQQRDPDVRGWNENESNAGKSDASARTKDIPRACLAETPQRTHAHLDSPRFAPNTERIRRPQTRQNRKRNASTKRGEGRRGERPHPNRYARPV